jgi:hypothetical protein
VTIENWFIWISFYLWYNTLEIGEIIWKLDLYH